MLKPKWLHVHFNVFAPRESEIACGALTKCINAGTQWRRQEGDCGGTILPQLLY